MANFEPVGASIQYKIDTGVRKDGKAVYRSATFSGFDPGAADDNIKANSDAISRFFDSGVSETVLVIRKLVA